MDQVISACITALVAVVSVVVAHVLVGPRWRKEREEKKWAEALAMARVAESPEESDTARMIARHRLTQLGIGPEWIEDARHASRRPAFDLFKSPGLSEVELETVERAVTAPPQPIDPDIARVVDVATWVDTAFHRARTEARAEEDTRVRIFLIMVSFALVFCILTVAAIGRATGLMP